LCTVCKFVYKLTHSAQDYTTYAIVYNLYTPEDGHMDGRNM